MKIICLLIAFFSAVYPSFAQPSWSWEERKSIPEKTSNNAVAALSVSGLTNVYSFSGIDSSKLFSGIHLKSFMYNVVFDSFFEIDSLPDNMGKIAASASTVGEMIYIIGGYHVLSNGSEISSSKVHIYNPAGFNYLPDGADIPVPIDDQVQDVWRDSLIYVVTGWSNTGNVSNVQIYNPSTNQWMAGTPTPNTSDYKVFGGSGVIIGDTIIYAGGAADWNGSTFPLTDYLRIGIINPNSPDSIVWSAIQHPLALGYRMGASSTFHKALWFGGSLNSYNFDGIAYDGSGGVEPTTRIVSYDRQSGSFNIDSNVIPPMMDIRGVAKLSDFDFFITGGMKEGQEVSDKSYRISYDLPSAISSTVQPKLIQIYPTMVISGNLHIECPFDDGQVEVYSTDSKLHFIKDLNKGINHIEVESLPAGIYFVKVSVDDHVETTKILVVE